MTMGQARVIFAFATFMVAMFPHPVAINGDTATFPETQLGTVSESALWFQDRSNSEAVDDHADDVGQKPDDAPDERITIIPLRSGVEHVGANSSDGKRHEEERDQSHGMQSFRNA